MHLRPVPFTIVVWCVCGRKRGQLAVKSKNYTKISPRVVNPRDLAGDAEEEEELYMYTATRSYISF